uniref:Uncharacterized protein n=1 Tax=Mycena chlorophos TaxID=658473 RepID=A0ABQ0LPS1_MYCCL|nr:predicted protein [Mycena chlorophos]
MRRWVCGQATRSATSDTVASTSTRPHEPSSPIAKYRTSAKMSLDIDIVDGPSRIADTGDIFRGPSNVPAR